MVESCNLRLFYAISDWHVKWSRYGKYHKLSEIFLTKRNLFKCQDSAKNVSAIGMRCRDSPRAEWLLLKYFDGFSTVHHSIELFHQPTLMHNFLYSLTICSLHYYPRHVLSINMPIFRRKNCIHAASDIFALCKRLHITPVESRLQSSLLSTSILCRRLQRAKISDAAWIQFFLLKMGMLMLEACQG